MSAKCQKKAHSLNRNIDDDDDDDDDYDDDDTDNDDDGDCTSHPNTSRTNVNIARVEELILENWSNI
jgi:hypothetical protein